MKVAWTAAPRAYSKASGKMGFSPRCKCRSLLVAHMDPVDRLSLPQCVGEAVERVSDHSIDALHTRLLEGFDQIFGCSSAHQRFTYCVDVCPQRPGHGRAKRLLKPDAIDLIEVRRLVYSCHNPNSARWHPLRLQAVSSARSSLSVTK